VGAKALISVSVYRSDARVQFNKFFKCNWWESLQN